MSVGLFINPENHVPTLEEMKHAYAKKHGSVLDKVSVLQPGTLLRFVIGENAFQQIRGTPLSEELQNKMRMIKERHKTLQIDRIAERCFPKFSGDDNTSVECVLFYRFDRTYALNDAAVVSFMNGVLNYVIPKDLISAQQRTVLIKFISERLLSWHSGTFLLAANESYPPLEYAVIEKEVKRNLMKIWAICGNDKYVAQELLDGITSGLTHFIALYALHALRSQTKVGLKNDHASFYFMPTYNRIKEHLQSTESGGSRSQSQCSSSINDSATNIIDSLPHETDTSNNVISVQTSAVEASVLASCQNANFEKTQVEAVNPLPLKRVKLEPVATGKTPIKLFPRDRPPDDIPVYDYARVKREKLEVKSTQIEIESHVSNSSSSNHVSGSGLPLVDEWDEVLRSIDADTAVPIQYKVMFRCLVMSNKDLRDHNKILRSQLGKHS